MTEIKRGPTDYMAETILAYIKENAELRAANAQLLSQLPEDMKHCTIQYKQCEKGHGELTATNWEQHACLVCQVERLNAALKNATHPVQRCKCGRTPETMRDCPQFNAHGLPTFGNPHGGPAGQCPHFVPVARSER